jgi:hypothetical protein
MCCLLIGHTVEADHVPEADRTGEGDRHVTEVIHTRGIVIVRVVHLDAVAIVKKVVHVVTVEGVILAVQRMTAMDLQGSNPQCVKKKMRVAVVSEINHVVLMLMNGKEVAAEVGRMMIRAAEGKE